MPYIVCTQYSTIYVCFSRLVMSTSSVVSCTDLAWFPGQSVALRPAFAPTRLASQSGYQVIKSKPSRLRLSTSARAHLRRAWSASASYRTHCASYRATRQAHAIHEFFSVVTRFQKRVSKQADSEQERRPDDDL